jgi:hypothetical protein
MTTYYEKNRDEKIVYQIIYTELNKEKVKESKQKWYIKNRDELLKNRKEYQEEYRNENKDKKKEYQNKNKDKIKEYQRLYRERKKLEKNQPKNQPKNETNVSINRRILGGMTEI